MIAVLPAFVLLVVCFSSCFAVQPVMTGYGIQSTGYASTDTACSTPLSVQAVVLGTCIPGIGTSTSTMFSADASGNIYLSSWNNAICSGTQSSADAIPSPRVTTCTCTTLNGVSYCGKANYYAPALPTFSGNTQTITIFQGACATTTPVQYQTVTLGSQPAQVYNTPATCVASSCSLQATGYQTTTCSSGSSATGTTAPSSSPATGTTSTVGTSSCFAGTEQVSMENGHTKAMADVQIGDRILAINNHGDQVFSDVIYLPHGPNEEHTIFAQIATESGRDLKMTLNHILPAGACSLSSLPLIAAGQIVVNDCVQTLSGREQVLSVGKVEGNGIYTVIAMEELIVVNGIVATPYGGINPTLANIYYNLHRLLYSTSLYKVGSWVQDATDGLWNFLSIAHSF